MNRGEPALAAGLSDQDYETISKAIERQEEAIVWLMAELDTNRSKLPADRSEAFEALTWLSTSVKEIRHTIDHPSEKVSG